MRRRSLGGAAAVSALLGLCCFAAGCIHPRVVLADRKTLLEEQAAGEHRARELELAAAGPAAGAVAASRAELQASGELGDPRALDALFGSSEATDSDEAALDDLLSRRCVGEGREGRLIDLSRACKGDVDALAVAALVRRANERREQWWRALSARSPGASLAQARDAWRKNHLLGVVCGAPLEQADGTWRDKDCSR